MLNELKYTVRSREIVDLVNAMKNARLTLSPYFQRNLVWRMSHKRDFIETILLGYPFPQIFLARGPIDLETMEASQAVVDGQQRLNTIREFIEGKLLDRDGRLFRDLSSREKEDFLKYEVAVIDFDLDVGDSRLKDIFQRLNRTYYSLSAIEKLASEYSASEFMLVARVLAGEISHVPLDESNISEFGGEGDAEGEPSISANPFSRDPGVDDETWAWLLSNADGNFSTLIQEGPVFSNFEFDRKVPLMFTLNLMCTFISGYYQRNDKVRKFLADFADDFPDKELVISEINDAASYIDSLELAADSIWWNKANFFTLMSELARDESLRNVSAPFAKKRLSKFADALPRDYALAAREAVGGRAQRELRGRALRKVLVDD